MGDLARCLLLLAAPLEEGWPSGGGEGEVREDEGGRGAEDPAGPFERDAVAAEEVDGPPP